jgi:flavin-binding protein dodecin
MTTPAVPEETAMTVAKTIEITATSAKGFDEAIRTGIKQAARSLENITSAWVQDQEVIVKKGAVVGYQVRMKVTFILKA